MNNKKIGCISLVEKELFETVEGREVAIQDLLIKAVELMREENISKYQVTEIDIHKNYGFERTEKIKEDEHGEIFLQEYIIYRCFAKVEFE